MTSRSLASSRLRFSSSIPGGKTMSSGLMSGSGRRVPLTLEPATSNRSTSPRFLNMDIALETAIGLAPPARTGRFAPRWRENFPAIMSAIVSMSRRHDADSSALFFIARYTLLIKSGEGLEPSIKNS